MDKIPLGSLFSKSEKNELEKYLTGFSMNELGMFWGHDILTKYPSSLPKPPAKIINERIFPRVRDKVLFHSEGLNKIQLAKLKNIYNSAPKVLEKLLNNTEAETRIIIEEYAKAYISGNFIRSAVYLCVDNGIPIWELWVYHTYGLENLDPQKYRKR